MVTKVSRYQLTVGSSSSNEGQKNVISLYNSGTHIVDLCFSDLLKPGAIFPPSTIDIKTGEKTTDGLFTVVFPRSEYLAAVDVLRNESPVYFEGQPDGGKLQTGVREAVGEGES